jgi:DNA-binding NtrC family response regulator
MCANTEFLDLPGAATADELCALLVYDQQEPLQAVERILFDWVMPTRRVRSCAGVRAALRHANAPALLLTDTTLPDGTWADVLQIACVIRPGCPVIVVSRVVDLALYLDVLANGAYDFVVPPIASVDLAYIVRGAILKGSSRRTGFSRSMDG